MQPAAIAPPGPGGLLSANGDQPNTDALVKPLQDNVTSNKPTGAAALQVKK